MNITEEKIKQIIDEAYIAGMEASRDVVSMAVDVNLPMTSLLVTMNSCIEARKHGGQLNA